jgi:hypothetical protein
LMEHVRNVGSVAHQSASSDKIADRIRRRHPIARS